MQKTDTIRSIMRSFATETGLDNTSQQPRRYLWTDAFAVCNYLTLYRETGEEQFLQLALKLVDQVHQVLGKHHQDSDQQGWLSGLDEDQALLHPTSGGLRIGKPLNERQASEAYDDQQEWDRDGQYFHYLTKWMHALNRVSQVTGESRYNQWACELAKVAYAAFTYTAATGDKRMYWKMSTDLSRPQVDSMGQHDPLDGLITFLQLAATAKDLADTPAEFDLKVEISAMAAMCTGKNWATDDPLGIGGLLSDAFSLAHLISNHHLQEAVRLESLLHDIDISLQAFARNNSMQLSAEYRLAFRELGLAIGVHAAGRIKSVIKQNPGAFSELNNISYTLKNLGRYHELSEIIENYWLDSEHQSVRSWQQHEDINNVMLATSLGPDGYLGFDNAS